ncbi:Beta-1,3-glucan-binding protein [Frankliniella fusca]|uniref:Beta-1,3-glucan-binding protein n=1 Tax=Frankliniella fusca TaxID=407009 RepID=A0AAE1LND2_9NEOP|nr:Beta-1,3-glucan-binding protein [Frankliniella fusca]
MPCPQAHKAHRRSFPLSPTLPLLAALLAVAAGQARQASLRQVAYSVPTPLIEALSPRGLRVSIPDEAGISLVRFHVGVNKPLSAQRLGTVNVEVSQPTGSESPLWAYEDRTTLLAAGDVLHYWLQVTLAGHTYERAGTFAVKGVVEMFDASSPVLSVPLAESPAPAAQQRPVQRPPPRPAPDATSQPCTRSLTSVNGRLVCQGELLFLENFDSADLSLGPWRHDVRIAGQPDFEFTTFTQSGANTYAVNGQLVIRPTLTDDVYGRDFVRTGKLRLENCTAGALESDLCSRQARYGYILPPVLSGRITTRKTFSFRYGTIEVRAKLPSGDWIYPELWLLPREEAYGPGLRSGRIQLALARGNLELQHGSTELGLRRLEAAVIAAAPPAPGAAGAAGGATGSEEEDEEEYLEEQGLGEGLRPGPAAGPAPAAVPFHGLEPSTRFAGPSPSSPYDAPVTGASRPSSTSTAAPTSPRTTTTTTTPRTTTSTTTTTHRPAATTPRAGTTSTARSSSATGRRGAAAVTGKQAAGATTARPVSAGSSGPRATTGVSTSATTRRPSASTPAASGPQAARGPARVGGAAQPQKTAQPGSRGAATTAAAGSGVGANQAVGGGSGVQSGWPSGYQHAGSSSSSPYRDWSDDGGDGADGVGWSPRRARARGRSARSLSGYRGPLRKEVSRTELPGRLWNSGFHNYTLRWTPDAMIFSVDGVELGVVLPEESGGVFRTSDDDPWSNGGKMAPFDREFYISLGLAVGGIHTFPEGVEGPNQYKKPWKNTAAKAMLSFWNSQADWYQSWSTDSALLVDFVQVTAL